jgi:3-oxoacyl-[acyl-carrier-protein] synthase II
VVTGLGVASPIGLGAEAFWDALIARRGGVDVIRAFDASTLPSSIGGELPAFKTTDHVPKTYRKSVKLMSRDIEIALVAAHEACKDARLPTKCLLDRGDVEGASIDSTRFGANIGAGLICPDLDELGAAFVTALKEDNTFDIGRWGAEGMNNLTPLWLLKFLPNMLACHVTIVHDAQAFSNTITCGEASSHLAIGEAFRHIARGAVDVCICGGAECKTNPMGAARAALKQRVVTDWGDDPASAVKPFAPNRSGTVVAEGGGLVILESLEHARARGARIYAELAGFGAASNTVSWLEPDASGAPLALAMRNALRDAEVATEDIDLIGAFGCGTVAHDAAEMEAMRVVFGADDRGPRPAIAIKGAVGNNGAGSGALDFCATVLALHNNTVPPSLNTVPMDGDAPLSFAADQPVDAPVRSAISVSYALGGGQQAALVVKRFSE